MIDFIVRGDSAVMRMAREGHVARTSSGRLERAHGFLLGAQCPDVDGLEHIVGPKVIHFDGMPSRRSAARLRTPRYGVRGGERPTRADCGKSQHCASVSQKRTSGAGGFT